MPKKMPKKITVEEAINIYMEEMLDMPEAINLARMNDEMEQCYAEHDKYQAEMAKVVAQKVAMEMEIAWDEHDWDEYMMSVDDDYNTEECIRRYFDEISQNAELKSSDAVPHKNMKAAQRRKKTAHHKKHIRRNAINAVKNHGKRSEEDKKATSCRGGYVVNNPKSLTMKTERIWNQAEKMKLVDDKTVIS